MKWIGQHIWDFISRFRNDVYLEKLDSTPATTVLVVEADGKVGTNTGIGTSDVDSVTTTDGTYIDMTPNVPTVGAVNITSDLSAVDGTSIATTRFLSKDNTWDVPTYSAGTVTGSGTATRVAFWDSASSIGSDADLYWDNVNKRLGIGTATPSTETKLHIYNSGTDNADVKLRIENDYAGKNSQLILDSGLAGDGYVLFHDAGTTKGIITYDGGLNVLKIINNFSTGAKHLAIDALGNVGINTFLPDEKLHVEGSIKMVDGNEGVGKVLTSDANGVGAWATATGGVTTVTTTDGTFIDLTPNAPTGGAVTVTADLSATGTPNASRYLRGDNTWTVFPTVITESTQSGGSGKQTSWANSTYLIPKKNGGNFLNVSSLNIGFANVIQIDQIFGSLTGTIYNIQVVLVCDDVVFPEGCMGEGAAITIGVIKDPMINGQTQFNYTFTPILNMSLPASPGTTSVICTECAVDITSCDAWTFAAYFDCEAEEPVSLTNVYIWCTLNKSST